MRAGSSPVMTPETDHSMILTAAGWASKTSGGLLWQAHVTAAGSLTAPNLLPSLSLSLPHFRARRCATGASP